MSKFFYFKGPSNQSKLTEEREHPFTSSEITYRFKKTSAVIWADLCSLWIWQVFFHPYTLKVNLGGSSLCSCKRFYSPAWICYNLPPFTQHGLYQVSAISFIMHIWLIKRPHVALHKNSCSRPLFPCIISQQSRPVETPNGRDFLFIYLSYCCRIAQRVCLRAPCIKLQGWYCCD